ncbi:MAG: parallel beta-helix domain-containing protein [Chitinophagales bacterium]
MYNYKQLLLLFTILGLLIVSSCDKDDDNPEDDKTLKIEAGATADVDAVAAFINVEDGGTIEFGEGTFTIDQALIMSDKNNVLIKGQGRAKTILDFSGQNSGGESIKISDGTNITLCGFTLQNGVSDAIKTQSIDGIRFSDISTTWVGDVLQNNGNYGIYPVLCNNVEIEGCYARGASDAGIYVGQSTNIVVKNNTMEENVAGVEIENCINADVHDNNIQNNSAGILVYDLGNITSIRNGSKCRVFDNNILNNNHQNYAPNPNGLIGRLPVGSGIVLLATDSVEVFGNNLVSNNLASISMASYEFTGEEFDPSTGYNPRLRYINIHDNIIMRDNTFPTTLNQAAQEIQFILSFFAADIPEIVYDGISGAGSTADQNFRIVNNGNINMVNFNLQTDPNGTSPTPVDMTQFEGTAALTLDGVTLPALLECN